MMHLLCPLFFILIVFSVQTTLDYTTMISILIFAILISLSNGQIVGKCGDQASRVFDACSVRPMIMGSPNSTFPRTLKQATKYCNNSRESIICMREFAKDCLDSLPRQGVSLIAYGMYKNIRGICKTVETRRSEYDIMMIMMFSK